MDLGEVDEYVLTVTWTPGEPTVQVTLSTGVTTVESYTAPASVRTGGKILHNLVRFAYTRRRMSPIKPG